MYQNVQMRGVAVFFGQVACTFGEGRVWIYLYILRKVLKLCNL